MERTLSVVEPSQVEFLAVDSLQKIFMRREPLACPALYELGAMKGETVSFQAAYRYRRAFYSSQMQVQATKNPSVRVEVSAPPQVQVRLRRVAYVPSAYPSYGETDSDYLTTQPGLFPDPLEEMGDTIQLIPFYWRSLWVDLRVPEEEQGGDFPVTLTLKSLEGQQLASVRIKFHVADCCLPTQKVIHTEWFYSDCLADFYQVPVFSDRYWEIVKNFMQTAADRGINMILTPLFTLPLDTWIGRERTTVQLVGVKVRDGVYSFDFSRLDQWVRLAERCGFVYFEMGHLFSQWGAKYAPKVMADVDGVCQRIFGWETQADSREYREFLKAFLPALTGELHRLGIAGRTYFHISDEPNEGNIDTYRIAREMVREELKEFPVLDALSTLEFYREGIVEMPVPTNQRVHEFLDAGYPHRWVYYCSGEYTEVSNRFFAQPSCRTRILGVQLYLYDMEGFLHWGYNYYNSQYSLRKLNPYLVTDADDAFPSGDSFLVYPGQDGKPVESLRLMVLEEAFNDCRALRMLEDKKGKAYVHGLVEEMAGMKITFSDYPRNAQFLIRLRERVNREIESCMAEKCN